MKPVVRAFFAMLALLLSGCNGMFDEVYDEAMDIVPAEGQIVVDATDWGAWYYIDLEKLRQLSLEDDADALIKAQTEHTPYPIPTVLTGDGDGKSGQYLYWFDVWGEGIRNNEFREFTPCDAQPEPENWTFAIHRNNVRTNGGAVIETTYTSMDELPETSEAFRNMTFVEDEWSENEVWSSQEQMLLCLVPSQGIEINKVLSSWLTMDIPPMPPAFHHNNHVFILRLSDGTYAALQLANYLSPTGTKCFLTINYKYPY
ncbi:MAG: HmuY family protein [Prevotella sp.]|nr:HmuY family protein [Prevotella sp.]